MHKVPEANNKYLIQSSSVSFMYFRALMRWARRCNCNPRVASSCDAQNANWFPMVARQCGQVAFGQPIQATTTKQQQSNSNVALCFCLCLFCVLFSWRSGTPTLSLVCMLVCLLTVALTGCLMWACVCVMYVCACVWLLVDFQTAIKHSGKNFLASKTNSGNVECAEEEERFEQQKSTKFPPLVLVNVFRETHIFFYQATSFS